VVAVTQEAIRVCGERAFLRRYPLERYARDARAAALMRPWTQEIAMRGVRFRRISGIDPRLRPGSGLLQTGHCPEPVAGASSSKATPAFRNRRKYRHHAPAAPPGCPFKPSAVSQACCDNPNFRGFVDFLRTELDRIGPAHADLCRDFFSCAVALELSFFEAAYTT
jgi:thiaminase/transcriptional activator TenA